ncbi:MAG: hypothetical protein JWN16_2687 [Alphaproteobacteria bacterium]|nr:hypothetical protein [Alphaproteobacteria bacterium]
MGFFRKDDASRWVDSDALRWSPEAPFGEPRANNDDLGWTEDRPEPEISAPPESETAYAAKPDIPPEEIQPVPEDLPIPANSNRSTGFSTARLAIGLAQGLGLYALIQSRSHGVWPGHDPYLFAALSLAGIFAPLVLLEGLGDVPVLLLALWSGIVAAALFSLGIYHHWRIQGPEQAHAGIALAVLTALMLVTAQALLRSWTRSGRILSGYRITFDSTWTLIARLLIWGAITAIAWALVGSGNSLLNWLRAHYPAFRPSVDPQMLILPLVALASAAAFDMTGHGSWSKRFTRKALLACWTMALPMLVMVSAILLATHLFLSPTTLGWSLTFALLLLVAVNASYRGDTRRGRWRKASEFAAAFLILALTCVAANALHLRVASLGWTAERLYAAAAIATTGLYGLLYTGAALISIGGGRWMQRLEIINPLMALLLVGLCLALASPLADPLQLAVASQAGRLERGAVDPAVFDFSYLRRQGVRFGADALAAMVHSHTPEVARDAAIMLSAAPGAEAPPPSEIGANITVRTPGARLPALLLAHDWSAEKIPVPPCLTRPAMTCDAWFMDLDRDGTAEILLVYGTDARWWATVMKQTKTGWRPAASFASPSCRGSLAAMRAGDLYAVDPAPTWQDRLVAGFRLTAKAAPKADLPCPR